MPNQNKQNNWEKEFEKRFGQYNVEIEFIKQYKEMKRIADMTMLPPVIIDIENNNHMVQKQVADSMIYFEQERIRRRLSQEEIFNPLNQ